MLEAKTVSASSPAVVDGNHQVTTGIMTMLACYLADGLATLQVLDATNKVQLGITAELQSIGKQESDEIDRLSSDNTYGDAGNWHDNEGFNPALPDAPGLQWLLANPDGWDNSTVVIQSMQSHISDVQLDYTNQTSTVQQKVDVNKDTSQDIESEFNSLMQSMMSGLVSILQTGNSARV